MNSLLQGLSACPTFIKWLEEFTTQYTSNQKEPPPHQYLSLTLLHLLKGTLPGPHGGAGPGLRVDVGCSVHVRSRSPEGGQRVQAEKDHKGLNR